jgi:hypothetical protein
LEKEPADKKCQYDGDDQTNEKNGIRSHRHLPLWPSPALMKGVGGANIQRFGSGRYGIPDAGCLIDERENPLFIRYQAGGSRDLVLTQRNDLVFQKLHTRSEISLYCGI